MSTPRVTILGGKLPLNTSGGLETRGHPIGASGLAQIYELVLHFAEKTANARWKAPGSVRQRTESAVSVRRGIII